MDQLNDVNPQHVLGRITEELAPSRTRRTELAFCSGRPRPSPPKGTAFATRETADMQASVEQKRQRTK